MRRVQLLVALLIMAHGSGCSTLPTSAPKESGKKVAPSVVTRKNFVPAPLEGYASISGGYVTDKGSREWSLTESIVIGVLPRVSLNIEYEQLLLQPRYEPNESGFGDLRLGAVIILIRESMSMPQLSFSEIIKLGTGNEAQGLGSGTTDFIQSFSLNKNWNALTINASFAYTVSDEVEDSIGWSLGGEYAFKPKVYFFAELSADHPLDSEDGEAVELHLGPYFEITPSISWDTNIGFGLTSAASDFSFSTGFTYSF